MPGTIRPPSLAEIPEPLSQAVPVSSPVAHAVTVHGESAFAAPSSIAGPASKPVAVTLAKVCPACGVHYPAEFKVCPRDAEELVETTADPEQDELVGQTLGSTYTILRVIGEGGMGRVYEARHNRIATKRFAVKMLHPEFARQPEVISRFQREAEAAAAIQSPYVVDVYDVDRSADGRPYLVAEYLEGQEFADFLNEQKTRMEPSAAVRIVRQICKALMAAHDKGVIHRDMKPENVFLTGNLARPTAKVIDFGISKIGDAPGTALTKTGMIMGTPSYMAPEQARGDKVDHRADIYAVGAILYCALTGQRPFDHADPTVTLTAVLMRDPPRPRSIEPSIPEALELVIQRAMSKSPGDRHQTMAELDADLAPFESSDAPGANRSTAPPALMRAGTAADRGREVAMARPMIVLLSLIGLAATVSLLLTAITGAVRLLRGGGARANLTDAEAIFLLAGVLFTILTPGILGVRYVSQRIWGNSAQAMALAEKLRRPILIGLAGYGLAAVIVRVLEAVMLRRAAGIAWPVWDLVLFVVGLAAAIGGYSAFSSSKR